MNVHKVIFDNDPLDTRVRAAQLNWAGIVHRQMWQRTRRRLRFAAARLRRSLPGSVREVLFLLFLAGAFALAWWLDSQAGSGL